ncbi:MAG: tryptophan synthase subunit alpha [Cyanobacteria bacterium]|nr:tryptophan synthase subunit alpha [Cyanobacteria bacterium CG_2015-16_32_12]NCO77567.1 tryptophan synthase subunit alpha [Cyanobacteria bacterium CG_2015-22_32_23]NCQ03563.1 tryptophan synthase subunit alpha [Cyanobacteria bacterium CG_2015-09_32_10]NCQ40862.1 tryptophan synthase subunit alpha [Cyanobacteria bacterium CG_2015-04_32_10]NCS84854.1 tryptophan synthase subunit alpha [Cyanobacteria bacterium CG_2015-02_32_10]
MTSISQRFAQLKKHSQCALIPFITAGDPDLETTIKAIKILADNGADMIELGVPYSDPLADGPVIQAAATRALKHGVSLDDVLNIVKTVPSDLDIPIILFTYYNPIFYRGMENFLTTIADAGVKGLVVPDLPLEEAENFLNIAQDKGIEVTLLVAPTSPIERIKQIAAKSQGFIYLVSVTGVTGMRSQVESRVEDLISKLKTVTDKPIGVGFGISEPSQATQMKQWGADGVIVGSAFVKKLNNNNHQQGLEDVASLCTSLKKAIE